MNIVPIVIYSHSEYSFLWKALIPLIQKYAPDFIIHFCFEENADTELIKSFNIPTNWIIHKYDDSLIWTNKVKFILSNISEEYVLFIHDDWLLINNINTNIISEMVNFMKVYNCSFLLSYSHISVTSKQEGIFSGYDDYYYYKESSHIFQPAIWKKSVLEMFCNLNKSKVQNEDSDCLNFMSQFNCYSVQNIKTVTSLRTTNSLMFPHMHALSQGLWNFTKYPILKPFLESFGIDTNTRGIHSWWELDSQ